MDETTKSLVEFTLFLSGFGAVIMTLGWFAISSLSKLGENS